MSASSVVSAPEMSCTAFAPSEVGVLSGPLRWSPVVFVALAPLVKVTSFISDLLDLVVLVRRDGIAGWESVFQCPVQPVVAGSVQRPNRRGGLLRWVFAVFHVHL